MAKPLTLVVPDDLDGERLDKVVAVLGEMPRSEARVRVDEGLVEVDGMVVSIGKARVAAGATVVFPPLSAPVAMAAERVGFGVLYEDDDVIVIDKPAGVTVHPGAGRATGTLAAGLMDRFPELVGVGDAGRWGLVHRLDRETSGALIVGRTTQAHAALVEALKVRDVGRSYRTLVQGIFSVPRGTVDAPIGRDPNRPRRQALVPHGRHAVTHYRMTQQWEEPGVAYLHVELETGRTHQIRVHLAAIGHSVLGDRLYGKRDPLVVPRLFLHAASVRFRHPARGDEMTVESPLPADLAAVLDRLGEPSEV